MTKWITVASMAALLAAAPASAQTRGVGGDWSLLGAETVTPGNDVISGGFGWPAASFTYTHGVRSGFDVGGRVSFLYGTENRPDSNSKFGMEFAVPLRWSLARRGDVRFLFHLDPGLRFYTYSPMLFGFQGPFGFILEFPVAPPLKLGLGGDMNASFFVTGGGTPAFFFGPLIGPWLEYKIDPHLTVGLDTRFGAVIAVFNGGNDSGFGLRVMGTVAYRL